MRPISFKASSVHFLIFSAVWRSDSDSEESVSEDEPEDELQSYLSLPQIRCKTEQDMLDWWAANASKYPNVAVMARQYLGCPASSATVERLFSKVGIAFSAKRKNAEPETLQGIIFANANI